MTSSEKEKPEALSLTEAFHRLGKILPTNQDLVTIAPTMKAGEALAMMAQKGYSQLPVKVGGTVMGMFSYRSFSQKIVELGASLLEENQTPADIEVEELIEDPIYAMVSDEFRRWFETLDMKDAILVGQPDSVRGLLTAMDILNYLYNVASPFVLLAEIELSVRNLIRAAVNEVLLKECCDRANARAYELEEMVFGNYIYIITHEENWPHFQSTFRGSRSRTKAKLDEVRQLRNKAFHFKDDLTVEEFLQLEELRNWIHKKSMRTELESRGVDS